MLSLNDGQRAAVYTSGKDLLVSASAGSGKTYSLCLRIIEKLCDRNRPETLEKLLIVTFTRAAAGEMRQRLKKMLKERLDSEKDRELRKHITRQMSLLPGAKISTIDSFCLELVRTNFDKCGVSSAVRVVDDTEMMQRKLRAMRRSIEKYYQEDSASFRSLTDSMLGGYNDKDLPKTMVKLYETVSGSFEDIEVLLKNSDTMRQEGEKPFEKSLYGKEIAATLKNALEYYIGEYKKYIEFLTALHTECKGGELILEELKTLESARGLADNPGELCSFLNGYIKGTLRLPSSLNVLPETAWFRLVRGQATALLSSRKTMNLDFDLSLYRTSLLQTADVHQKLYELFADYRKELSEIKKRMGALEFSDIERLTVQMLYRREGDKYCITEFAKELSKDFNEVYIDEYQDVNELQDSIFRAISRNNRFAVGDVKQSIYGFRGACPDIFSAMREEYPDYRDPTASKGKIFLLENYRSAPAIIRFANACCRPLLSLCTDMRYVEEDDLLPKREMPKEAEEILPAICLVPASKETRAKAEAQYLAKSVKRMVASGVKPEDIGVLVRNMTRAKEIRQAFDEEGLIIDLNCRKGFFETPEVLLLRCILLMVDNPTKDIYLAGAMKSPVFGFTLEELTEVRQKGGGESLFSALVRYTEETGNEKCKKVLKFIAEYRREMEECTAEKLVFRIMSREMLLPLLSFGKTEGEGRSIKDNLLFFYELVRSYSSKGTGELSKLLDRIEDAAQRDAANDGKNGEPVAGHVRLMTIHGSKGLEFPVCWLFGFADTGGGGQKLIYHPDFGCNVALTDLYGSGLKRKSAVSAVVRMKESERELDEELRILYVALTRARDRLYISATVGKSNADDFLTYSACQTPHRVMMHSGGKYINALAMALGKRSDLYRLYQDGCYPVAEEMPDRAIDKQEEEERYTDTELQPYVEEIANRLNFRYPFAASVNLPEKLSVSRLSPNVLDEEEQPIALLDKEDFSEGSLGVMPRFYREKRNLAEDMKDFAKRGSATHSFMQFCDFSELEKHGVQWEKRRLQEAGFLSAAVAELVEENAIEKFLESDLYFRLKRCKRLFREQRFTIELPAGDFTEETEKKAELAKENILVQGVIDCFFEDEEGKVVLFDYKTDHFSSKQLKDRQKCKEILQNRHRQQLYYYKTAVEKMMGKPVDHTYIYSFALSESVELK